MGNIDIKFGITANLAKKGYYKVLNQYGKSTEIMVSSF